MYHRFPAERRAQFGKQLDHVRRHYRVFPLEELARIARDGGMPANALAITVDDGHRDFYEVAYPELKARGMPATVFLATGFLDGAWLWFDRVNWLFRNARADSIVWQIGGQARTYSLKTELERAESGAVIAESMVLLENAERDGRIAEIERELAVTTPAEIDGGFAPLRWEQVREMAGNGIQFGAHTVTHPTLSTLTERARIDWELGESKRRVEQETQREAAVFCYPNGRDVDISDAVLASTRACGFRAAVQTEPGLNTAATDPLRLRRMAVDPRYDERYFARLCAVMRR